MLRISTLPSPLFRALAGPTFAIVLGAGVATGQQIFQVSPGGTYPTVQAAIDAANHGDILRLAAGAYPEFTCTKGVRIEGAPGAIVDCSLTLTGGIEITGIPAGAQCVLSGITMRRSTVCAGGTPDPALRIRNSAGSVLVERVQSSLGSFSGLGCGLIVENVTGGVLVHDSAFINSRIVGTTVHLTRVAIRVSACGSASDVFYLEGADVLMVDGEIENGYLVTADCCRLLNSRLTLGVAQGLQLAGVVPSFYRYFTIGANSQVVQHTRVVPANPTYSGGPWLRNDEPVALRVFTAPPGGVVAMGLYVYGPAVPAVVLYGTQAPPTTLPFIDGPLALGSNGLLISLPALVTPDWSTTPAALAFGVPFVPALQGQPLAAQGFVYGGSAAPFRATNAVGFTLQ